MIFICVPAALTFSSPVRFDCALVSSAEVKFDNFPLVVTADVTTTVSDSRETWGATQCSYIRNNGQWTPLDTIGHQIGQFYVEQ